MIKTLPTTFVRDRFTWLAYLTLGYFAYYLNAPGVAMPLLRADLDLSYSMGGLHISALAVGSVAAGLLTPGLVRRFGRRAIFWGGGAGTTVGALLLAVGHHPALTLPAITFMGLAGTTLLATVQSSLADHHGHFRALALTEANVVASGTTILAPLLVGSFARLSFGWRGALIVPAGAWLLMFLLMRDQPVPAPLERDDGDSRWNSLPRLFWFYWLALLLGVAVEWSIITWGGDFLVEAGPLTRANASLVMSAFFVAMLIGRFLGAVLARRVALAPLLLAAMVTGLVGFLIFWLVPLIGVRLGGLFLAGLGVANLFPLLLSIAMGIAGPASDLARARITLGTGSAILLAPLTLGWIADRSGISAAYLLVALFFGVMITVALVTRGFERRNLQPL